MDFKENSMRKGWSFILILALGFAGLHADVRSGKMFYMKHMKTKVKMDGASFAKLHTSDEWQRLFADDARGFVEEFSKRYPKYTRFFHSRRFLKKAPDLADFAIRYASDTGRTPTCGGDEPRTVPAILNPAGQSTASPF